MKTNKFFVLLFSTLLLISFSTINTSLGADPVFPRWQVGNWWKFNVEYSGAINLVGTQTFTVVSDDVDVFQNGQNFNCYQIDLIGGGTIFGTINGNGVDGTWTLNETHYYTKTDLRWVKINSIYEETISDNTNSGGTLISTIQDGITLNIITDLIYHPPFEANKGFPLNIGKSWSAATTEIITTETTIGGYTESTTENDAYTKTFLVLRKELITTSIGETETYVIKRTDPDGDYAETYYSSEVGTDIKAIEYDSTGSIYMSMELLSYEYQPVGDYSNLFSTETFTILIIVIIIVISVIMIFYLLKRKKPAINSETTNNIIP